MLPFPGGRKTNEERLMALCFQDKVVFITGASSGIGAATARAFAREGARVALAARRKERLETLAGEITKSGGTAMVVACDVCQRSSLDAAVAEIVAAWGGIDVVLANAGFGVAGAVAKLTTDDFRRQFDTNFFGVIDTLYAALPHLIESKGRFGVVASVAGRVATPLTAPYCSSKFALVGFTEALYYELRRKDVSVTCINPGFVTSEIRSVNNDGQYTEAPDPVPQWLVMPAETAARQVVRGLYRRKAEIVITLHGKLAVALNRHFPGLMRLLVRHDWRPKNR
jgi:short-subunit dehydrogenase